MTEQSDTGPRTSWDVIVMGTGSGGKIAAQQLAEAGRRVLAVEAHRFGGECPYTACVPAKSLLASAHAGLDWAQAVRRRDEITDGRDDQGSLDSLTEVGVTTVRGRATVGPRSDTGPHRVRIEQPVGAGSGDPVEHTAEVVVVATGSSPSLPPVDGLERVEHWTSDIALSTDEQPASLMIMGGGAVGCELAQAFAVLGTSVDLIEVADRVLPGEQPWCGAALADQLEADGVRVHTDVTPHRAEATATGCRLIMDDGSTLEADRLLVAGGRTPNSADLGLETLSVALDDQGSIRIDHRCRVLDEDEAVITGLYAVGDVTAESSYTHSANYQAKVVAHDVIGRRTTDGPADDEFDRTDYRAIPRVVYTEPPVFCVGLTSEQADDQGRSVRTAKVEISDVERAALLETSADQPTVRGGLEILVDAETDVVVGAACVGPQADAWGAELALAIRAAIPVSLLRQHVRAFPTWSEAITAALDDL